MLRDWLAANINHSASGRDGYKSDSTLNGISAPYIPAGSSTTISLYPGEGAYSYYSGTAPSVTGPVNIKYDYFGGNTLLTYNVNTNNKSSPENGQTTGATKPSINIISGSFDMKLGSSNISGPFPIGMGDVNRMNNNSRRINFDVSKLERVFINE
jgi:hypothetical protein